MTDQIPISEAPAMEESQSSADIVYNEGVMRTSVLGAMSIIDRDDTAPPGTPSNGDVYIPATTATGAWATHEDDIAIYFDGWIFITPYSGMIAYVEDENIWIAYDGTEWHPLQRTWSTSEYWTGEYFGGSKLYAKTVNVGTLPNNTSSTDAHGISGLATVVRIIGTADNGTNQIPLPYFNASNGCEIYIDDTYINLVTTSDLSGYSGYVTLEYTKS